MIEPEERYKKKQTSVLGRKIAYVDQGVGDSIVFLHGNPTSSFLWRNIIPYVSTFGRCIAPDLLGMGQSQKVKPSGDARYRFAEHQLHMDIFLELVGATDSVTLVLHEFGSILGFDWARRHSDAVSRIIYTEALVQPLSWEDWPDDTRYLIQDLRTPGIGEAQALDQNVVVEGYLPDHVQRLMAKKELETYRAPFQGAELRRPVLNMIRELPIDGEPPRIVELVERYGEWLAESEIPKLFVNVDPGYLLTGKPREFCRTWPNQVEVTVEGLHYPQEDSPRMMATEIIRWLQSNPT